MEKNRVKPYFKYEKLEKEIFRSECWEKIQNSEKGERIRNGKNKYKDRIEEFEEMK